MVSRIVTVYLRGFNKGVSSRFCVGSQVRHETPEGSWRTYRPKRWEYMMRSIVRIFLAIKVIKLHLRNLDKHSSSRRADCTDLFDFLSSIHPFWSSFSVSSLDGAQCQHSAGESKFFGGVIQHWCFHVLEFMLTSPAVLLILLGWFVRWQVSIHTVAVCRVLLPGFVQNWM